MVTWYPFCLHDKIVWHLLIFIMRVSYFILLMFLVNNLILSSLLYACKTASLVYIHYIRMLYVISTNWVVIIKIYYHHWHTQLDDLMIYYVIMSHIVRCPLCFCSQLQLMNLCVCWEYNIMTTSLPKHAICDSHIIIISCQISVQSVTE